MFMLVKWKFETRYERKKISDEVILLNKYIIWTILTKLSIWQLNPFRFSNKHSYYKEMYIFVCVTGREIRNVICISHEEVNCLVSICEKTIQKFSAYSDASLIASLATKAMLSLYSKPLNYKKRLNRPSWECSQPTSPCM